MAKAAFAQAAARAHDAGETRLHYSATLGLGDVALGQGSLPSARRLYETDGEIARREAAADKGNAGWQRDVIVSNWKLARFGSKDERRAGWVEVIRRLQDMKARGILAPVDEKFIATAKDNLAKVEAE